MIVRPATIVAIIVVLLHAIMLSVLQLNADQYHQSPIVVNTSSLHWRRPGCYRIGHMRTISIPGCLKFNLTTNACRGYCLSFSVPWIFDTSNTNSSPTVDAEPVENGLDIELAAHAARTSITGGLYHTRRQASQEASSASKDEEARTLPDTALDKSQTNQAASATDRPQSPLELNSKGGNPLQNTPKPAISPEDKREIVSVSQCCNMMETEEVVVNLRCAKEMRKLVFKSAKTCECFFCKHV